MKEERLVNAGNLELILPNGKADSVVKLRASTYENGSYVCDKALFSFGLLLEKNKNNILKKNNIFDWVKGFSDRFGFNYPGYIENAGNYAIIDLINKEIHISNELGKRNSLMKNADKVIEGYGFKIYNDNQ